MSDSYPKPADRGEYLSGEAFLLHTDVARQTFDEVYHTPLERLPGLPDEMDYIHEVPDNFPAESSLFVMSRHLIGMLPRRHHRGYDEVEDFDEKYGVTDKDIELAGEFADFELGFGDPDFAWHFAPAVAAAVVHEFQLEGLITPEERQAMTLGDWADIIGSGWFGKLMHSMALTSNGIYMRFGNNISHYLPNALRQHLNTQDITREQRIFELSQVTDENTGRTHWTAELAEPVAESLRDKISDKSRSVGCPVARKGTKLHEDVAAENPHALRLIREGHMLVGHDADPTDDDVRVKQWETAIDVSLTVFADKLDQYAKLFGEPRVVADGNGHNRLSHKHMIGDIVSRRLISQSDVVSALDRAEVS